MRAAGAIGPASRQPPPLLRPLAGWTSHHGGLPDTFVTVRDARPITLRRDRRPAAGCPSPVSP